MSGPLQGKVALITGGGRGIGRALAIGFARSGAAVVVTARTQDEIEAVAAEIVAGGGQATAVPADVSLDADVQQVVTTTLNTYGQLDILVNNAAVPGPQGLLTELDLVEIQQTFAVNLCGPLLCCRAVTPHMIKQGGGNIINISSGAGQRKRRQKVRSLPYQVSKFGLEGLTNALAVQLREYNINVNALLPGVIATRFHERTSPERLKALGVKLGQPEDVVPAAVYLASREPGELTDQVVNASDFDPGRDSSLRSE